MAADLFLEGCGSSRIRHFLRHYRCNGCGREAWSFVVEAAAVAAAVERCLHPLPGACVAVALDEIRPPHQDGRSRACMECLV